MTKQPRWVDYDGAVCPDHPTTKLRYVRSRRWAVCTQGVCRFYVDTGEFVDIPDLPPDPPEEETVPLPQCQFVPCIVPATYDFVTKDGPWAYGCTKHWMEHRATRELGPGKAQHLTDGRALPERPPGATILAVPEQSLVDPTKQTPTRTTIPRAGKVPRAARPREFVDMEAGPEQKQPKAGVQLIALELGRVGFTLEELQAKLNETGGKHDALKLLLFMHTDRGWGWKQGEDGKIKVQP